MSNGTFSKIFGPGMRLGWMEMPVRVKRSILNTGVAISGGGFNHCISGVMESVISLGILTQMLQESRPLYRVGYVILMVVITNNSHNRAKLFHLNFSLHALKFLWKRDLEVCDFCIFS